VLPEGTVVRISRVNLWRLFERADPIALVEAHRLRSKLQEYY